MDAISLPQEVEEFANLAVARGRYRDVADLMQAAVALLRQAEAERADLILSIEQAQAEAERDGFASLEVVEHEMRTIIKAASRNTH